MTNCIYAKYTDAQGKENTRPNENPKNKREALTETP